jgi:hypothetical protein
MVMRQTWRSGFDASLQAAVRPHVAHLEGENAPVSRLLLLQPLLPTLCFDRKDSRAITARSVTLTYELPDTKGLERPGRHLGRSDDAKRPPLRS